MTNPPSCRRQVTLSSGVIESIRILADSDQPPEDIIGTIIHLINGVAWFEDQASIDPTLVQIPDTQWTKIAGYLSNRGKDDKVHRSNLALSFMNSGPSTFHPEDEARAS